MYSRLFLIEDPLNTMYRADSDRSLGDSDENVMEGGVTIKQHVDQRPPVRLADAAVASVASLH